ncbi:MAG: shikimate kinase [Planctomycetaceae bacterium]|nr:shikimate kinase [Planctomycetaceae bacterium]
MVRLILVGYRASGKTTIAEAVARYLKCPVVDADVVFEQKYECSVGTFIQDHGEASFRDAETSVLREVLQVSDAVLSTGGGVILREENRLMIRDAGIPVVWVSASAKEIRRRLALDETTASRRPALQGKDVYSEVEQALADREMHYDEVAGKRIDTDGKTVAAIVEIVLKWLFTYDKSSSQSDDLSAGAKS